MITKEELMREWAHIPQTNEDLLGISFEDFLVIKIKEHDSIKAWFKEREASMIRMEAEIKTLEDALRKVAYRRADWADEKGKS